MQNITVSPGQTFIDVAMQTTGSADPAFDLAAANGMAITEALKPGDKLVRVAVTNPEVKAYYDAKAIVPAEGVIEQAGGIGYWVIGSTFQVS